MEKMELLTDGDYEAVEQMKQIWRECFDAEDAYLELYFSTRYKPQDTAVYREDGRVLGMLTLMPCSYRATCSGKLREYKAGYLFAVGTLPSAQGRGISTKLIAFADEVLRERGMDMALLAPAEPGLFPFYRKRGYEDWFMRKVVTLPAMGIKSAADKDFVAKGFSLKSLSIEEYYARHIELLPTDAVIWPQGAFEFAAEESLLYNGGLYVLMDKDRPVALCNLYRYTKDEVIAKEFLPYEGEDETRSITALRALFPDAQMTFRFTAEDEYDAEPTPSGMIRFYGDKEDKPQDTGKAYLSFLLD